MSIFDALKKDHDQIKGMIIQIEEKMGIGDIENLFEEFKATVLIHSRAEEDSFYSELEEHQEVELMLGELDPGDAAAQEWRDTFSQIKADLLEHIHTEETELFRQAASLLAEDDLERLANSFMAERERLFQQEARDGGTAKKRA
jgi:hemerythrin superfamily protein